MDLTKMMNINITNNELDELGCSLHSIKRNSLSIIDIDNELNLSQQYAEICRQYSIENKWILMINPDEEPLEQLTNYNEIDTSKILKVHANKHNLVLANIEKALCKGNCSAIVICNPLLSNEEITQLSKWAEFGKTSCIVIRNNRQVH
ncbi:hypothetical protein GCM10025767_17540 [Thalassotalea piscium]